MSTPPSPTTSESSKPSSRRSLQEHQMESARKFLCESSDDDDFDSDDEFACDSVEDPKARITSPSRPTPFKTVDRNAPRKTNLSGAMNMNFDKSCCYGNRRVCNTMLYQGGMKYKLNKIFLGFVVAITLIVLLAGIEKMLTHHKAKQFVADHQPSGDRLSDFGYKIIEMGLTRTVDFEDPMSPQSLALEWIAETDGAKVSADDPLAYERYALAVLYYVTAGTDDSVTPTETGHWNEDTHWMSDAGICQWHGVVCQGDDPTASDDSKPDHHGSVQSLQLPENGLYGWMPAELSALTNLYTLDLSGNKFWGHLPSHLGKLVNLREMSLRSNDLDWRIPTDMLKLPNMRQLDLGDNRFEEKLDQKIFNNMPELRHLALDKNQFVGTIPPLKGLTKLKHLMLEDNGFTGEFPLDVIHLTNLETLSLGFNDITGNFPEGLEKLTALEKLFLEEMKLTGSIPPETFHKGNHLKDLRLNDNNLKRDIPTTIGHLTKLENMVLGKNKLSGSIPREIGFMTSLVTLDLHANHLYGTIPHAIGHLSVLQHAYLHRNSLTGTVTSEIGRLQRLHSLFLETNDLSGSLPSHIGNVKTLVEARFYENYFEGFMPEEICSLQADEELVYLGADCDEFFECMCCTTCF